jgi:hypothetical protein
MTAPAVPRIPMTYKAEIRTCDGWWFRYVVHRTHGIGIPENSASLHRTLKGAQRAARRYVSRNDRPASRVVEEHGGEPKLGRRLSVTRLVASPPVRVSELSNGAAHGAGATAARVGGGGKLEGWWFVTRAPDRFSPRSPQGRSGGVLSRCPAPHRPLPARGAYDSRRWRAVRQRALRGATHCSICLRPLDLEALAEIEAEDGRLR